MWNFQVASRNLKCILKVNISASEDRKNKQQYSLDSNE